MKRILRGEHGKYQLIRHLLVGGTGVIFNWLTFSALRSFTHLSTLESTLIVHVILLILIFPLQKFFTFQKKSHGHRQIARFLINDGIYVVFDYLLAAILIDKIGLVPIVGKAIGLAILTPGSFLLQRHWVFRHEQ